MHRIFDLLRNKSHNHNMLNVGKATKSTVASAHSAYASIMASSSRPKVLVTRGDHDPGAIQRLAQYCDVEVCPEPRAYTRAELLKGVKGKDALLILPHDKINEELVNAAGPQLKVIGTHSVGHDHIDQILMKKKKIKVGYTPGILSDDVADLAVCLTLMTTRKIKEHVQ